jgi:hypothetical protein
MKAKIFFNATLNLIQYPLFYILYLYITVIIGYFAFPELQELHEMSLGGILVTVLAGAVFLFLWQIFMAEYSEETKRLVAKGQIEIKVEKISLPTDAIVLS